MILWVAGNALLLIFPGLLLAVLLVNLSRLVQRMTNLSYAWSLGIVLGSLMVLSALIAGLFTARIATEADQLIKSLQSTWQEISSRQQQDGLLSQLRNWMPMEEMNSVKPEFINRIAGVFSSTFGLVSSVILILFIGIFTASDPGLYRRGLLRMIRKDRRYRVDEVISETVQKLWWWILGQLFSMTVVGLATGVGLWALKIPFSATLGLLSGLLTFIPNFGPILSAVPAVLLASTSGLLQIAYVAALYLGIQLIESNLLTPLVQQRNVRLPAVLNVSVQVLMGILYGVAGLVVASPLAVVGMVLVQRFYVEDYLGDSFSDGGHRDPASEQRGESS
jgi:predicted PurR-regulated permease PerM